ncbi:MAG: DUF2130 domain-containing protein [Bacteroidota bacterium]
MATEIKCPNCGHEFEPTDLIRDEIQKEVNSKAEEWKKKKEKELEESLRKNISSDFETKLRQLEQNNKDNEEKLKLSRQKELEFLKKEQELLSKEKELDLQLQRLLLEERSKLTEIIRKEETDRIAIKETEYQMKLKEKDEKIEAIQRKTEEMQKRIEQGSMQTQGEVQELLLEELLKATFPFDVIEEVGKGVEGADCIQIIRNSSGKECGRIIYESKRTRTWSNGWIDKLKNDMRAKNTDIAILVSQAFPKDMTGFGFRDGIWICSFSEVKGLSAALREGLIKVYEAQVSQENRGDKMQLLYNYLTGVEFRQRMEAIVEAYNNLEKQIIDEKKFMQKKWEERRKLTDKVLENTIGLYGSIKGIAGGSFGDIPLLESPDNNTD